MKSQTGKLSIGKVLFLFAMLFISMEVRAQYVLTNPLEWMALAEGNELINGEIKTETKRQLETATLQNTMAAEFTKIHVEKARVFDPLGHAGFDPSGKIRLPP